MDISKLNLGRTCGASDRYYYDRRLLYNDNGKILVETRTTFINVSKSTGKKSYEVFYEYELYYGRKKLNYQAVHRNLAKHATPLEIIDIMTREQFDWYMEKLHGLHDEYMKRYTQLTTKMEELAI